MRHSRLFRLLILPAVIIHVVIAEVKQLESFDNKTVDIHGIRKRSALGKSTTKFMAQLVLESISLETGPIPFLFTTASFMIGALIDGLWPNNQYDILRAQFLEDIHKEMDRQSMARMRMKLNDYGEQLQEIFHSLKMPPYLLRDWQQFVKTNELSVTKQRSEVQKMEQSLNEDDFMYLKDKISALTVDLRNDRSSFYIPHDPFQSLAYYREYANLVSVLLAAELLLNSADDGASSRAQTYIRYAIKSSAETNYQFVYWAAHTSAKAIEIKTRIWQKYNEVVESVLSQFPMDEWRELSDFYDDTKYIRNNDVVSFKMVSAFYAYIIYTADKERLKTRSSLYEWLSCTGSGSQCVTRGCPGEDNPFENGNKYVYNWKCRGEVFRIYGDGRHASHYIRVCDKVALQYSYQNGKGYWLSKAGNLWKGNFYKTRTCPGWNFFDSNFHGKCNAEVFDLEVEGRSCGERVQDRDVLKFRQGRRYVTGNTLVWWGNGDTSSNDRPHWRVFKHNSFLKDAINRF